MIAGSIAAGLNTAVTTTAQTLGFGINYRFSIQDNEFRTPDEYSYDAVEFNGDDSVSGVLAFEENDVMIFGDSMYPPAADEVSVDRELTLPMSLNLPNMEQSTAFFLVGLMATLLGGSVVLRNLAAGAMWGLSFVLLIMAGVFGFGLELFWMGIVMTVLLLIVGMVARWG